MGDAGGQKRLGLSKTVPVTGLGAVYYVLGSLRLARLSDFLVIQVFLRDCGLFLLNFSGEGTCQFWRMEVSDRTGHPYSG